MIRQEFIEYSKKCSKKQDWLCQKTQYACKDYLCPDLKSKQCQSKPVSTATVIKKSKDCAQCQHYGVQGESFRTNCGPCLSAREHINYKEKQTSR